MKVATIAATVAALVCATAARADVTYSIVGEDPSTFSRPGVFTDGVNTTPSVWGGMYVLDLKKSDGTIIAVNAFCFQPFVIGSPPELQVASPSAFFSTTQIGQLNALFGHVTPTSADTGAAFEIAALQIEHPGISAQGFSADVMTLAGAYYTNATTIWAPTGNVEVLQHLNGSGQDFVVAGSVPEPATWGMMLLGFFGLGFAAMRQKRTSISIV